MGKTLARVLILPILLVSALAVWSLQFGLGRQLLWPTVEACLVDHALFHAAAPRLLVETRNGVGSGYAIVRSPEDKSHVVLTPTIHLVGIEAPELRRPGAPNYVADAWSNRRFAYPDGHPDMPDEDVGLAINSQRGRTQDQLHVHIDCLLQSVKDRLSRAGSLDEPGRWSQITFVDGEPPYWATALPGALEKSNVIDLAASHLKMVAKDMPLLTLAVVARRTGNGDPGFILLTRKDFFRQHAELLLDHDCVDYRRRERRSERRLTQSVRPIAASSPPSAK